MGAHLQCLLYHLSDRHGIQPENQLIPPAQDPKHSPRQGQSSLVTPKKSKMGIKETGDYITARAANPRTGLISPSVVTTQTPRTPMSPDEALRLHDQRTWPPGMSHMSPSVQHSHQRSPKRPASRWKQHKDGWFVETINEVMLPKAPMPQAKSSVVQARKCSVDRFILPMPSARNPRPYLNPARIAAQLASGEHSAHESNECSHPPSTTSLSGLNNRMASVGAGPRKFAEATKKLRLLAMEGECALTIQDCDIDTMLPTIALKNHSTPNIAATTPKSCSQARSTSAGSLDSVMITMISMPGNYETPSGQTNLVARKPVGSPPRTRERKTSQVPLSLADVLASHHHQSPFERGLGAQTMSETNSCRFDDFRQLPRVRTVHLDQETPFEQAPPIEPRAQFVSSTGERSAVPINSANLFGSMKMSSPVLASKGPWNLESEIPSLVTVASLPLYWIKDVWESTWTPPPGLLRLMTILTDERGDPSERLEAGKFLLVILGRWVVLLTVSILVLKVGIMLGQVVSVLCWPIRILFAVFRWSIETK